jgi:hypothetical protein
LDVLGDGAHPASHPGYDRLIDPADERAPCIVANASDTTDSADVIATVDGLAVTSAVCRGVRRERPGC